MPRVFVRPEAVGADRVRFDPAEAHHLGRVLRLRPGGLVDATDGAGHLYTVRLVALGLRKAYHTSGIGTLFYQRIIQEGLKRNYTAAECSWILENNDLMNRPIEQMGGKRYKTYRLYEKTI